MQNFINVRIIKEAHTEMNNIHCKTHRKRILNIYCIKH